MKKILLFFLFLIVLLVVYSNYGKSSNNISITDEIVPSPTPMGKQIETPQIIYKNQKYNYFVFKVKDISKIELMSNLKNKVSTNSLFGNQCDAVINAGFYGKNDLHLGLFATKDEVLSSAIDSKLFNGFFYLPLDDSPVISSGQPSASYNFALQSGPLLIENSEAWNLNVLNDEEARRMFAGISINKDLYFGVVYREEENYQGPYLNDLPEIVKEISGHENLNLESAINLDGGSASAFYTDSVQLPELTTVGGFFCIK